MVNRALVVFSAIVASIFVAVSCTGGDGNRFQIGAPTSDAKVFEDARPDAPDAHADPDARPDAPPDAAIPQSCMNKTSLLTGSGANESETLIVFFDCGTHTGGNATVFLHSPDSVGSGSGSGSGSGTDTTTSHDFTCGNNTLTFPANVLFTARELVGVDFDLICN